MSHASKKKEKEKKKPLNLIKRKSWPLIDTYSYLVLYSQVVFRDELTIQLLGIHLET